MESPSVWLEGKCCTRISSVQVQSNGVIVSDDGPRFLRLGFRFKMQRAAVARGAARLEAFADVIVGDDSSLLLEVGVSTDVVAMIVRVDDEAYRLVGNSLKCCVNLIGERRRLVIDQNNAIVAH